MVLCIPYLHESVLRKEPSQGNEQGSPSRLQRSATRWGWKPGDKSSATANYEEPVFEALRLTAGESG